MTTSNRFVAVCMGVLVTILIQRSTATDMMVIGFVNSGLMTLMQAIGVIMGANIGTTITAQITAFNKAICPPAVAIRQAQLEITRMGRIASENLNSSVNASSIQPTINIDKSKIPKIPSIISPTPLHKNSSKSELSI